MKALSFLFVFIVFFSFTSCNPFSLDDTKERKRDSAEGQKDFKLPELKNINIDELKSTIFDGDCSKYKNYSSFSILGESSLTLPLRNCIAKAVDEGLKPICDQEKQAKELLDHYKDQRDKDRIEETEMYLLNLKEAKYDFMDFIYEIADEFDEIEQHMLDEIDDEKDENSNLLEKFLHSGAKILVKSEFGSFTKLLDTKARMACGNQIDFSLITKKRR